jgi:fatty acid desaturase
MKNEIKYDNAVALAKDILSKNSWGEINSLKFVITEFLIVYSFIFIGLYFCLIHGNFIYKIIGIFFIVSSQQHASSMVHELSHFTLSRNRKINDLCANLIFGSVIGMNVEKYRKNHLTHHANLGSYDKDRDSYAHSIDWTDRWMQIFKITFLFKGIINVLKKYSKTANNEPNSFPSAFLYYFFGFFLIMLVIILFSGNIFDYIYYWIIPLFTISQLINYIRTSSEHQPFDYTKERNNLRPLTRTTSSNLFEKILIYGSNFNFHFEHHAMPRIVGSELPLAHLILLKNGFYEKHPELLSKSCFGTFLKLGRGV